MIFKHAKSISRSLNLHPITAALLFYSFIWAKQRELPFIVTDTVSTEEEDRALERVSESHKSGRAFDISLKNWSHDKQTDYFIEFTDKFGHLGALTTSGERRLIKIHNNGNGYHLHFQIGIDVANENPKLEDL
jgi:hypothetical protein